MPTPTAGLARRDFLKLVGLGGAASLAGGSLLLLPSRARAGDFNYTLIPASKNLDPAWVASIFARGTPTVVTGADIRRQPAFEFRHHAPSGIAKAYLGLSAKPTDEEQRLFVARRRLGAGTSSPTTPSTISTTGSGKIIAQVVKDARAKLDAGADYVQLVPMDNNQQCKCANCQALIDKDNHSRQFSTGKASGLFWSFANAVARELRQSHPDKYVGTIAYYDYAFPPSFDVEPNILVGPCLHTRNWWTPSMERNDLAFYQGWLRSDTIHRLIPDPGLELRSLAQFGQLQFLNGLAVDLDPAIVTSVAGRLQRVERHSDRAPM